MISLGYLVLFKNKKRKDKIITLRDTRGTISFALRISFPNKDYKSRARISSNIGANSKHEKQKIAPEPRSNDISFTMSPSLMDIKRSKERERNKRNARKWKDRNPDKYQRHLEWVRQWRKKNRQKLLDYNQKYRDSHREKYREQQRNYQRRRAAKKKLLEKESVNKSTKNDRKTHNSRRKKVSK